MNQDSQPEIEGLIVKLDGWARSLRAWSVEKSENLATRRRHRIEAEILEQTISALLSLKEGGGLASCTDSAASVASQPDCSTAQSQAGGGDD